MMSNPRSDPTRNPRISELASGEGIRITAERRGLTSHQPAERRLQVLIFCRSLARGWNRGSTYFLRGIAAELIARGHSVIVHEDTPGALDLEHALDHPDLVIVHESSAPELIKQISRHRECRGRYRLLFHDTRERPAAAPLTAPVAELSGFDGALASSEALCRLYAAQGWGKRAWTWHGAADIRASAPRPGTIRSDDLVWIGDWGDRGRREDLQKMLFMPARRLKLSGVVHGPDYPWQARRAVTRSGLRYGGPLSARLTPAVFARHRFTVQLPNRAVGRTMPGIPTIRMFEALACGIPLICSQWEDVEGLFTPGRDYLVARDQREMESAMHNLINDRATAVALAEHGRATVLARHTCAHRVDELLAIDASLRNPTREIVSASAVLKADQTPALHANHQGVR